MTLIFTLCFLPTDNLMTAQRRDLGASAGVHHEPPGLGEHGRPCRHGTLPCGPLAEGVEQRRNARRIPPEPALVVRDAPQADVEQPDWIRHPTELLVGPEVLPDLPDPHGPVT
jgi:hypothetical protein